MASIFDSLRVYGGKWSVKSTRKFSNEELAMVDHAEVVSSEYGNSCCFFMKSGSTMYIPMSQDARSGVGDSVDLKSATIITLEKSGNSDITRIQG